MHIPLLFSAAIVTTTLFVATVPPAHAEQLVPVPSFHAIGLKDGGSVTVVPAKVQRVVIRSGSTAYSRIEVRRGGSLEIDGCITRCPNNYRLEVEVQTPNLDAVAVANGGQVRFAPGFPVQGKVTVAVSNGGAIDMRGLRVTDVLAAVDSGGAIELGAPTMLQAAVTSGGLVRYRGNPQLSMAVSHGGSVERAN